MPNVSLIDGHIDEPKTNYDRIRNMSVEEMAWFLAEQVMKQESMHWLEDKYDSITATQIEVLKRSIFMQYLRYLESEVEGE